jgi:uncharacterized damage-inducible protein DinB
LTAALWLTVFKKTQEAIMYKDAIILFARYNKSVNEKMDGFIKSLSPQEWNKDLGGHFKTVRNLCSHLYMADINWLRRFKNLRDFSALKDPLFDHGYVYTDVIFEDSAEYLAKRPKLDDKILALAGEFTDGDLDSSLKYTDPHGKNIDVNFGSGILRFLSHGTHHRGMLSLYLELLGRENDVCSLGQVM